MESKQVDQQDLCELCLILPNDKNASIHSKEDLKCCSQCSRAINYAYKEFPQMRNVELHGFFTPQIDCIIENKLYLGNKNASKDLDMLNKYNITDILVSGNGLKEYHTDKFNHKTLKIDDSHFQDLQDVFQEAIDFIDQGKVVYVHCFAGVSRSSSMVIAYLMAKRGMKLEQALQHTKERRPKVLPNDNFLQQLKKLEENLQKEKEN